MTHAWHFTGGTLRDGRPLPPAGETLRYERPLVICESGLHASIRLIDALSYAPGPILHRVDVGDSWESQNHEDKIVSRERTILWSIDATDVLRAFARKCALDVIHLWDAPDVIRQYLETGDESLREDARVAARDAARDAAWDAAWAAAWAAARDATWGAALAAARDAARDAAWGAARDAAWEKQNERLTKMVLEAAGKAE